MDSVKLFFVVMWVLTAFGFAMYLNWLFHQPLLTTPAIAGLILLVFIIYGMIVWTVIVLKALVELE